MVWWWHPPEPWNIQTWTKFLSEAFVSPHIRITRLNALYHYKTLESCRTFHLVWRFSNVLITCSVSPSDTSCGSRFIHSQLLCVCLAQRSTWVEGSHHPPVRDSLATGAMRYLMHYFSYLPGQELKTPNTPKCKFTLSAPNSKRYGGEVDNGLPDRFVICMRNHFVIYVWETMWCDADNIRYNLMTRSTLLSRGWTQDGNSARRNVHSDCYWYNTFSENGYQGQEEPFKLHCNSRH